MPATWKACVPAFTVHVAQGAVDVELTHVFFASLQLVHKMRSGMAVEEAVDDIVTRGVSELRKNAFGDDIEDAKSLPWTREQAWILLKQLSKQPEVCVVARIVGRVALC